MDLGRNGRKYENVGPARVDEFHVGDMIGAPPGHLVVSSEADGQFLWRLRWEHNSEIMDWVGPRLTTDVRWVPRPHVIQEDPVLTLEGGGDG